MNDKNKSATKPEIGSDLKVKLKGESPWVTVLAHTNMGVIGKIQNKLFAEYSEHEQAKFSKGNFGIVKPLPKLHNYKQGDEIEFIYTAWKSEAYPDEVFYDWLPLPKPPKGEKE